MTGDERRMLCDIIANLVKIAQSHGAGKEELVDALDILDPANMLTCEIVRAEISRLSENQQSREPSSRTNVKSRRFRDRHLGQIDLVDRFEANSSWKHAYDARSAIERVRDDGAAFWNEGAPQLKRWRDYCNVLWRFINTSLGERRHLRKQVLAEALREFFHEFEHSTHGMYEMLYGVPDNPEKGQKIREVFAWLDLAYRFSTYAITAFWLDDKTEETTLKISMNLTTGETSCETTVEKEMQTPKKYKHAAKSLDRLK